MKLEKIGLGILTCALLAITGCENANNGENAQDDTATLGDKINEEANDVRKSLTVMREEDFVTDVLESNADEMAWLREGVNMGTDAELKSHAQQMMKEHQQLDADMRAYAGSKNINLEDVDTSETVRINDNKGNDWDEEWADEMGDMHRSLIRRFERAQKRVEDTELSGMITKTLPTLRTHLDMVEKLEEKLDKRD